MGQILQGRKTTSGRIVDLNVNRSTSEFVVTGRSVEVPVEAENRGSASVPISVIAGLKRISGTYKDENYRIRISVGKLRFQNTTVSNEGIAMRNVGRRIIDIPEDAIPRDILSLPLIFSVDEIEDCGLHAKVLDAQKKLAEDLNSAYSILHAYGFDRNELSGMAKVKIKAHADAMRNVLFASE